MNPAHDWHHVQRVERLGDDHTDGVWHAIRVHRYSNALEPEKLEAEILCDADNLNRFDREIAGDV
jgi:hypothetical protein